MALRSSKKCQEPLAQHVTYLKMFMHLDMLLNLELSPLLRITAYSLHCFMVTLYEMRWTPHITVDIVRTPQVCVLHVACHSTTSSNKTSLLSFKYQQNALTICDTVVTLVEE